MSILADTIGKNDSLAGRSNSQEEMSEENNDASVMASGEGNGSDQSNTELETSEGKKNRIVLSSGEGSGSEQSTVKGSLGEETLQEMNPSLKPPQVDDTASAADSEMTKSQSQPEKVHGQFGTIQFSKKARSAPIRKLPLKIFESEDQEPSAAADCSKIPTMPASRTPSISSANPLSGSTVSLNHSPAHSSVQPPAPVTTMPASSHPDSCSESQTADAVAQVDASEPPEDPSGVICLLCRRKFESVEKHSKHKMASKLHKVCVLTL